MQNKATKLHNNRLMNYAHILTGCGSQVGICQKEISADTSVQRYSKISK